jgi:predicted RND superfamily exporter protein
MLARHQAPGQTRVHSGLPALRATLADLVARDINTLVPLALLVVLVLLFFAFRSASGVLAGFVTILLALIWSMGALGVLGYSLTVTLSITPIIVIIISLSDTVHIVNEFAAHRRQGEPVKASLISALSATAIPCLTTEVVLACGFLSLVAVNISSIVQFGIGTAAAMILTWLSNMLVLPLALSFFARKAALPGASAEAPARAPWAVRTFGRLVGWIEIQVSRRQGRVVAIAAAILLVAAGAISRVEKKAYVFDDLRPESPVAEELRRVEAAHGGLVPLSILIETSAEGDGAALDPELVALADRAAQMLRSFPEIRQAHSVADFLRTTHQKLAADGSDLPASRSLAAQEVAMIDDGMILRDVLAFDRRSLVAQGTALDVGSPRTEEMFHQIEAWIAREQAALKDPRVKISSTGQLRLFRDINDMLVEGLVASFAGSLLVSFLVMCLVLRSWKLGLVGLVPNLVPIVLVTGLMAALGITLKPSTVLLFSITLVIAEDDTIQYLSRYRDQLLKLRDRWAGQPGAPANLDAEAALACLREVGLPMFITSSSVSAAFGLLLFSQFLGVANLGILIGSTLFAAVFADLFLTPILLARLRPFRKLTR